MSSGGITQLVAIGAQDIWLTGKPEISYFQSAYKRHTNFSHVVDRQTIQGNPSDNAMTSVRFERKGDMLSYVYITATANNEAYAPADWSQLINYIEFYVGGQLIDSQDTTFSEYIAPHLFAQTLAKSPMGGFHGSWGADSYFYPLRFFFCENCQSALPLCALQYHDVEIRMYWGPNASQYNEESGPLRYDVYTNFIFLDDAERKAVTSTPQNLLITQVQKMPPTGIKVMELVYNHPVKYLASAGANGGTSALVSTSNRILMQANGVDLCEFRYATPNYTYIPRFYHTPCSSTYQANPYNLFLYPFCIDTAKLQPSGTLNFSRLDSFRIISETDPIEETVYAVNYNVLRIENGMGGLMYSN
jgi:Major capsid protein N-terminus/Large eukaryotic DNA virus major capsid protein